VKHSSKILNDKGSSGSSFERFQKDLFNEILCDPPSQKCEGESGSKKVQIKNFGKNSRLRHRTARHPNRLHSSLKVCACFCHLLLA